jgi:hypothetical protein
MFLFLSSVRLPIFPNSAAFFPTLYSHSRVGFWVAAIFFFILFGFNLGCCNALVMDGK